MAQNQEWLLCWVWFKWYPVRPRRTAWEMTNLLQDLIWVEREVIKKECRMLKVDLSDYHAVTGYIKHKLLNIDFNS